MNNSDLRTRSDAINGRSCLVTRTSEPDETPILTLLDAAERNDGAEVPDPLIQVLIDKLPKPDTIWSVDDRAKWLKAAAMAFNLVYRTAEQKPEQAMSALKSVGDQSRSLVALRHPGTRKLLENPDFLGPGLQQATFICVIRKIPPHGV